MLKVPRIRDVVVSVGAEVAVGISLYPAGLGLCIVKYNEATEKNVMDSMRSRFFAYLITALLVTAS